MSLLLWIALHCVADLPPAPTTLPPPPWREVDLFTARRFRGRNKKPHHR